MKLMRLNIQLFGHTNETENYDLPQFVGTDKPTWLGDFNTAMSTIDTAVGANATAITSLGTRVTSAEGTASQASSDVASLTSTVSTLSSNVTSATTTANNAQSTATSALNTANTADGKADTNATAISGLDTRVTKCEGDIANFNLTDYHNNVSVTRSTGTYTLNNQSLNYATNSDGSLAKIYGQITATAVTAQGNAVMSTTLRPESDLTVVGGCIAIEFATGGAISSLKVHQYTIKTNGTVEIPVGGATNGTTRIIFINSLIYVKDFGDTPVGD